MASDHILHNVFKLELHHRPYLSLPDQLHGRQKDIFLELVTSIFD